jgi:hypothetical protein
MPFPKINPQIDAGAILVAVSMIASVLLAWGNVQSELSQHEARITQVEKAGAAQSATQQAWQTDIAHKLDAMLLAIGQLQGSQQRKDSKP